MVNLPLDLLRHDMFMTMRTVPDESIVEIVDGVRLPLLGAPGPRPRLGHLACDLVSIPNRHYDRDRVVSGSQVGETVAQDGACALAFGQFHGRQATTEFPPILCNHSYRAA
ncbi:hypothetical protein ABT294_35050 [Nonomuraea sp. NPDC000554]|uniref:hypothetical protein n=1 Tax=Nonomuraea sp. NPDC000554 TaxID=3154259 RepID=UPI00332AEC49